MANGLEKINNTHKKSNQGQKMATSIINSNQVMSIEDQLALALPVSFRNKSISVQSGKYRTETMIKSREGEGKLVFTNLTIESPEGPIKGASHRLFIYLMTKYGIQIIEEPERLDTKDRFNVYFSKSKIMSEFNLDTNSTSNIDKWLDTLSWVGVEVKEVSYDMNAEEEENRMVKTNLKSSKLITEHEETVRMKRVDGKRVPVQEHYATLNSYFAERIINGFVTTISQKVYLSLKGPRRSLYVFICAKRKVLNMDDFTFDINEVVQILDYQDVKRPEKYIKSYLEDIRLKSKDFSFFVKKSKKTKTHVVHISFHEKDEDLGVSKFQTTFYSQIANYWGEGKLEALGFIEADFINWESQFMKEYEEKTGQDFFHFQEAKLNPVEFAVDQMLWQIIEEGYPGQGKIKALTHSILRSMINDVTREDKEQYWRLPDSYRFFVRRRLIRKKKEEVEQAQKISEIKKAKIIKEEEEKADQIFDHFFEHEYKNNSELQSVIIPYVAKLAEESCSTFSKESSLREGVFASKEKEEVKKLFDMGTIVDQAFKVSEVYEILPGSRELIKSDYSVYSKLLRSIRSGVSVLKVIKQLSNEQISDVLFLCFSEGVFDDFFTLREVTEYFFEMEYHNLILILLNRYKKNQEFFVYVESYASMNSVGAISDACMKIEAESREKTVFTIDSGDYSQSELPLQ